MFDNVVLVSERKTGKILKCRIFQRENFKTLEQEAESIAAEYNHYQTQFNTHYYGIIAIFEPPKKLIEYLQIYTQGYKLN